MKDLSVNVNKVVYVAFIEKAGERHYLKGSYWGDGYRFGEVLFMKPLSQIGEQGNESLREEDYIVKAVSVEDMEERLKKCGNLPRSVNGGQITILRVAVKMEEDTVSVVSPFTFQSVNESMEAFEAYFVETGYAKKNHIDSESLKEMRSSNSDDYTVMQMNKFYQAWKELQGLK